jgi:hypothetical protein
MGSVTKQDDVAVVPGIATHHTELLPGGSVGEPAVSGQLICEEALAVRNRVRLAEGFHARQPIRFLVGLHDERGAVRGIWVDVGPETAVFVPLEEEREAVERPVGPEPRERVDPKSMGGPKCCWNVRRTALLTPSLPITRSASRWARGSGTSC